MYIKILMWEGKFSSLKMPQGTVVGKITVDYIDINSDGYTTNAVVKYTGIYRRGKSIKVSLVAKGNNMEVDLDGRQIVFTIESRKPTMVTGSYIVKGLDRGQFYLQPEGSPEVDDPSGCIIF